MEEFGELEEVCPDCDRKRWGDLSAYTRKLLWLRRIQKGGYPFGANDHSLGEWADLGRVNEALDAPRFFCPLMGI